MTASSWVQLNDLRENWVFLLLGTTESPNSEVSDPGLLYWEVGIGNADQLLETETGRIGYGPEDEPELVADLLETLADYRYTEAMIITPTGKTVQQLRRRVAAQAHEHASLRGFTHVSIESVLSRYFGQSLADYEIDRETRKPPRVSEAATSEVVSAGAVRNCWEAWQEIFRLVPADELAGSAL